ncbi:MAG: HAD family hydrolase [Chitinophagaceae bacterium]
MGPIKNIIFDLGGVLLNIDYQLTENAFAALGFSNFSSLYTQFQASPLFEDLETGRIQEEAFVETLKKRAPVPLSGDQIREAWNAMLLDFPIDRLQLLRQLQNPYNLYLLSNTNSIHLKALEKILLTQTGFPNLDPFFKKVYYSHLFGRRKPEPEIYQMVLEDGHLDPGETLFIDDNELNVEGARKVGINGILLVPPTTILDIFKSEVSRDE